MAELWYYTNEGVQMDAVTIKELKRLVGEGSLKPTDMVWKEGMARWIRASSVTELFPDPSSALDHYFTHTGGKAAPAEAANPQHNGVKAASTPAAPTTSPLPAASEKGAPKKSSADDETERRKPPKRRSEAAAAGGGMNWGIMIAIFLGAGVLLTGLVVGIVILIVVTRPADGGKDGPIVVKNNDKVVANNDKAPPPPAGAPKIGGEFKYTVSVAARQTSAREFHFEAGDTYEIVVKSQPRHPDVDLYVINPPNGAIEIVDTSIGPDSLVRWSPNRSGPYRVEVRNLDQVTRVQSTVTIREFKNQPKIDKKEEKKIPGEEPLPPDTLEKSGSKDLPILFRGKETSMKFRVKAGHKASFSVTPANPINAKITLVVVRENNTVVVEEKDGNPNPRVQFELPNTEIVRVRIINNGKSSVRGTLLYNVSP